MKNCEIKSTGTLVDELGTLDLKIAAGNTTAQERRHELANVVIGRTVGLIHDMPRYREFQRISRELNLVLKDCWDAQETVMSIPLLDFDTIHAVAKAAKIAQETNALRNRLIRQLDELVGESDRTQLEKTYG